MNNKLIKLLLLPFALIFGAVVFVRNRLFDWQILPSAEFSVPLISVGNLRVGGTGKTPHVEYLIEQLSGEFRVAVLSRGYKRKTKGFVLAGRDSSAFDVGDELFQISRKYPEILVAADGNRKRGIRSLLDLPHPPDLILLDDAFQHRWVKPGLSIVLIDYNYPVHEDFLLPAGRLREPKSALSRADIVLISKSPKNLSAIGRRVIYKDLELLSFQHMFFTCMTHSNPIPVFPGGEPEQEALPLNPEILLVTGVANPDQVKQTAAEIGKVDAVLAFPDHHFFTDADVEKISHSFESMPQTNKILLTTEKDAVRLRLLSTFDETIKKNFYYIPIRVEFQNNDQTQFNNLIFRYARSNKRNRLLHPEENRS